MMLRHSLLLAGPLLLTSAVHARPAQVRSVALLDFQSAFSVEQVSRHHDVAQQMTEGFEEPVRPGTVMLQDWTRPPDVASSSSFLRIPRWMRTGVAPTAALGGQVMAIGRCGARPWRPSQLMGSTAEERRRLLYPLMQEVACEAGIPVGLFDAMLIQESRYNPFATSVKGAFGLGQLMPGTARQLGVNRYDLRGNLTGSARYLKAHLSEFGRADLALAAYNAGPGKVRESYGVPRIKETRGYVANIIANWLALERGQ